MSKKLSPLPRRKFLQKLKRFGIFELPDRGKGGEFIVRCSETGIIFTLPHLKEGEDVRVCYIQAVLRRFGIRRESWLKAG